MQVKHEWSILDERTWIVYGILAVVLFTAGMVKLWRDTRKSKR